MNQIKALNKLTKTDESDRIIEVYSNVSLRRQYEEALHEKLGGNRKLAIEMLEKLLLHERFALVLNDGGPKEQSRELYLLRYNCYKHLADMFLLDGNNNKAFNYIFKARDLDDKDVFVMHEWGKIALQQKQLFVAYDFFVKAIEQNPKHWPSMQGILAVLCAEENFFEAYGWALNILDIFPGDQTAVDVMLDIRDKLGPSEYLEKAWSTKFNYLDKKRSSKPSLFPIPHTIETIVETNADFTKFIVNKPTFLLFGRMIKSIYLESVNDSKLICERVSLNRICPTVINYKNSLRAIDLQRSSEVSLREIRKICFEIVEQFSCNGSIIIDDKIRNNPLERCQHLHLSTINTTNNSLRFQKSFHTESLRYFQHFMIELTDESFTMIGFMFKWLKYFSMCCRIKFPNELRILFFDIYNNQRNHIDLNGWEHLPYSQILDLFRMSLFYLELKMMLNASEKNYNSERLFDDDMVVLLSHMLFIDGLYLQADDERIRLRLKLLHFQYAMEMKEFDLASELLTIIKVELAESSKRIDDKALSVHQPIASVNRKSRSKDAEKKIKKIASVDIDLNHNISGKENALKLIKPITVSMAHRRNSIRLKGVSDRSRMIRKNLKRRSTVLNDNKSSIQV